MAKSALFKGGAVFRKMVSMAVSNLGHMAKKYKSPPKAPLHTLFTKLNLVCFFNFMILFKNVIIKIILDFGKITIE